MSVEEEMRQRLESAFQPSRLEVLDESEGHRGHAGWREGGGTHWRIRIEAPAFATMSRVQRHRAVHAARAGCVFLCASATLVDDFLNDGR